MNSLKGVQTKDINKKYFLEKVIIIEPSSAWVFGALNKARLFKSLHFN